MIKEKKYYNLPRFSRLLLIDKTLIIIVASSIFIFAVLIYFLLFLIVISPEGKNIYDILIEGNKK